jgi:hypothetical protein
MKTKTLLAMGLCAAIGLFTAQPSLATAQEHHEHKEGEAHGKVQIPETLDGIWKEIHHHHQELKDTVKAGKLAEVHEHAFAIRDLGKALPAKVPAEHKKHLENMVKKLSQIAADLDKSGDANNQAQTEANLKKLDALLKDMEDMAGPSEAAPHKH